MENSQFTYAFQPIVDISAGSIISYEALIRGVKNEPAHHILKEIAPSKMTWFDGHSRSQAVALAAQLGIDCQVNLNVMPQTLAASDSALQSTLDTAHQCGFALDRLVLEITEQGILEDLKHVGDQLNEYRGLGIGLAIDDFGAGYSGLNLLAQFQPDQIKIDMNLVRGIAGDGPRQAIVRAISQVCFDLGIEVIAEGVETLEEFEWFAEHGVELYQGYLFAKPGFECLPPVKFPVTSADLA